MVKQFFIGIVLLTSIVTALSAQPVDYHVKEVGPYMAYHEFPEYMDVKNSVEAGMSYTQWLTNKIGIGARLGFSSSFKTDTSQKNHTSIVHYGTYLSYNLMQGKKAKLYTNFGIQGDLSGIQKNPEFFGGLGLSIQTSKHVATRFEINGAYHLLFGFTRQLTPIFGEPEVVVTQNEVTENEIVDYGVEFDGYLEVPKLVYNFVLEDKNIKDIKNHWARDDVRFLTGLGVMNVRYDLFEPSKYVTQIEASQMIIMTTYLQRLLEKETVDIKYTVIGEPGEAYFVDMHVEDVSGNVVNQLLFREQHYKGQYTLNWDGSDSGQNQLSDGEFVIRMKVYNSKAIKAKSKGDITVVKVEKPSFNLYSQNLHFNNSIEVDWGKKVIQEATKLGIIDKTLGSNLTLATQELTRLEFIKWIANALAILGAETREMPDLSLYRDSDTIPSYALNFLNLYIIELGYGGDKKTSYLRPNEKITRAEAAVILKRLIYWKKVVNEERFY